MTYIATFKRFHLVYAHSIEAPDLKTAMTLAEADLQEQRRKNHPAIVLVKVESA